MRPLLDGEALLQDLEELGRIGARAEGGLWRMAYGPDDAAGRAWVEARMRGLGMEVARDAAGNTIGRYAGSDPELRPIALGSHTDTVPGGGRYDGSLGVLGALACVRALHEAGVRTRHTIEVINFASEEATVFGTFGSEAMAGQLDAAALDQPAWDGRPVAEHLRAAGLDPAKLPAARRPPGSLAAYLELHIEQGGVLEADGLAIGVVEGIVGIRRFGVSFAGMANHAGTTPMAQRRDALVAAAAFVLAVRDEALARGIVGTVGTLHVHPNASNVIPGLVELSCEIRALHEGALDAAAEALGRRAAELGGRMELHSAKPPVASDAGLLAAIERACVRLRLPHRRMPSGAGHDAMCMAALAPMAMLFVPSRGGISHAASEYTAPEECVQGARVLLETLLDLDRDLDG